MWYIDMIYQFTIFDIGSGQDIQHFLCTCVKTVQKILVSAAIAQRNGAPTFVRLTSLIHASILGLPEKSIAHDWYIFCVLQ